MGCGWAGGCAEWYRKPHQRHAGPGRAGRSRDFRYGSRAEVTWPTPLAHIAQQLIVEMPVTSDPHRRDDDPFLEDLLAIGRQRAGAHAADIVEMRPGLSKGDDLAITEHRAGEYLVLAVARSRLSRYGVQHLAGVAVFASRAEIRSLSGGFVS
jgi:hypothetical protein